MATKGLGTAQVYIQGKGKKLAPVEKHNEAEEMKINVLLWLLSMSHAVQTNEGWGIPINNTVKNIDFGTKENQVWNLILPLPSIVTLGK